MSFVKGPGRRGPDYKGNVNGTEDVRVSVKGGGRLGGREQSWSLSGLGSDILS